MNKLSNIVQAVIVKSPVPITGYDIAKLLASKTKHSHQQVYRELAKLRNTALVHTELVKQSDKPDKLLYSVNKSVGMLPTYSTDVDFTKSDLAASLLIHDIINGTDFFDKYISKVTLVAIEFQKLLGKV